MDPQEIEKLLHGKSLYHLDKVAAYREEDFPTPHLIELISKIYRELKKLVTKTTYVKWGTDITENSQ